MRIRVNGQHALSGSYCPSGNANAAIALLAASLLTDHPVTLNNVPQTVSTNQMLATAEKLGTLLQQGVEGTLTLHTPQITSRTLSHTEVGSVGALLYAAPVLIRRQHVRLEIDFPLNRIRTHLEAMRDLGLDVVQMNGAVECTAVQWKRRDILLSQTSVTVTAMVMMLAACLGEETTIYNAASEPHLQELANLLVGMGAQIDGKGTNRLHVFGTTNLHGAEATIGPDHIEAASIAAIAAMSGGRTQLKNIRAADMRMISKIYARLGIQLDMDKNVVYVPKHDPLSVSNREEDVDASIETAPWPGFPSDLVAVATVIATQARGTSLIHEKLFPNRLLFVDKLKSMGAQIVLCDPHRAIVVGATPLRGVYMDSPDVRAGLGMLAAALVAHGESVIDNAEAIEHTFGGVVGKLQALGASITVE